MEDTATPTTTEEAAEEDLDTKVRKWREQRDREYDSLRKNARALWRSKEKWKTVRDADEWAERYIAALED